MTPPDAVRHEPRTSCHPRASTPAMPDQRRARTQASDERADHGVEPIGVDLADQPDGRLLRAPIRHAERRDPSGQVSDLLGGRDEDRASAAHTAAVSTTISKCRIPRRLRGSTTSARQHTGWERALAPSSPLRVATAQHPLTATLPEHWDSRQRVTHRSRSLPLRRRIPPQPRQPRRDRDTAPDCVCLRNQAVQLGARARHALMEAGRRDDGHA
jgi:hypothetical protein